MAREKKTHCRQGHPLSGDNVRISNRGHRICWKCAQKSKLKWKRRNPEKVKTYKRRYYARYREKECAKKRISYASAR